MAKKVSIKQKILSAASSGITGYLFILSDNGKVLILNSDGEYVNSLDKLEHQFTSISCANECLYLGTHIGNIQ